MVNSSTWVSQDAQIGLSVPGSVDATSCCMIGTVRNFRDNGSAKLGTGEFIYLPGVASTIPGDIVNYLIGDGVGGFSTTRWAGTANTAIPLAIATASCTSGTFGWYQIGGAAIVNIAGTVAVGDKAFFTATGSASTTSATGKQVIGMTAATSNGVPDTGKAVYTLNRPVVDPLLV